MNDQRSDHLHDLAITISVGELTAEQFADVKRYILAHAEKVADGVNVSWGVNGRGGVERIAHAYVSYDGKAECGC